MWTLARGKGASARTFQQAFAAKCTTTSAWDTMLGFHVPCCVKPSATPNVCKRYVESALNAWLNRRNIMERQPPHMAAPA